MLLWMELLISLLWCMKTQLICGCWSCILLCWISLLVLIELCGFSASQESTRSCFLQIKTVTSSFLILIPSDDLYNHLGSYVRASLQMRELKSGEGMQFVWGHLARKWINQDQNEDLCIPPAQSITQHLHHAASGWWSQSLRGRWRPLSLQHSYCPPLLQLPDLVKREQDVHFPNVCRIPTSMCLKHLVPGAFKWCFSQSSENHVRWA